MPVLDPSIVSLLESQQGLVTRRSLLDRDFHLEGVAESGLEQLVIDAIDASLPAPVLQHRVQTAAGSYRRDLAEALAILRRHLVDS